MSYLPLHQKVIGYNTYIISQIYHRETMCPLTPNQIQTLEKSFIRQYRKVAYISMDTLKTSRKFGGFEMTDLNSQIRYIKFKYLNNILFEKEPLQATQIFWCKIQYAINELMDYAYQEHHTEQRTRLHRQGIGSMDSLGHYSNVINDRIRTQSQPSTTQLVPHMQAEIFGRSLTSSAIECF